MIGLMQERPPYVRFEIATHEYRDNSGVSHARDVERILVTPAGSKDVHVAIADEWIKAKEMLAMQNPPAYPPQWAEAFRSSFNLWRKGADMPTDGVPIRSWPVLSPSEVKRCLDCNVLTVEDLAQVNEQAITRLGMGARSMKDKAATWLKDRDGSKSVQELEAVKIQNVDLMRQVGELTETVNRLAARIADGPKPKRSNGRPPEQDNDADVIR